MRARERKKERQREREKVEEEADLLKRIKFVEGVFSYHYPYNEVERIMCMKCTTAKNNKLEFIEIWDIPTPNLNSIGVRELIPNICSVMFVFDCISLDDEKEKKNSDSNLK